MTQDETQAEGRWEVRTWQGKLGLCRMLVTKDESDFDFMAFGDQVATYLNDQDTTIADLRAELQALKNDNHRHGMCPECRRQQRAS